MDKSVRMTAILHRTENERFPAFHEWNIQGPQGSEKKILLLVDSGPDSMGKKHSTWKITGMETACLNVWQLHCSNKNFKDAPIIAETLKSFRGIITVGRVNSLPAN